MINEASERLTVEENVKLIRDIFLVNKHQN